MTRPEPQDLLARGHAALRAVAADVLPDDRARPTPCAAWTVAQVVEHALLDQGIWASAVGGVGGPDGDAFAPVGDLPADLVGHVDATLRGAARAWVGLADGATVSSPLPQGQLPVAIAASAAALDAAVHAWDVARAIGSSATTLDDELAAALLPAARALVEPLRRWGAYASALPAEPGESPMEALLRHLGRDPRWTRS